MGSEKYNGGCFGLPLVALGVGIGWAYRGAGLIGLAYGCAGTPPNLTLIVR